MVYTRYHHIGRLQWVEIRLHHSIENTQVLIYKLWDLDVSSFFAFCSEFYF